MSTDLEPVLVSFAFVEAPKLDPSPEAAVDLGLFPRPLDIGPPL